MAKAARGQKHVAHQQRRQAGQPAELVPGRLYRDESTRQLVDTPPGYEVVDYAELIKKAGKMRPDPKPEGEENVETKQSTSDEQAAE